MRRLKGILGVIGFGLLASCETASAVKPPITMAPGPLTAAAVQAFDAKLLVRSLTQSPDVAAAQANRQAAEARLAAQGWAFAPTPFAGMTADGDGAALRFGARQPLWSGGRISAARAMAGAELARATAALRSTERDQLLTTIDIWANAHGGGLVAAAWEESLAEHDALVARIERRLHQGAASRSELQLAQSRRDMIAAEREIAVERRDAALERLAMQLGDAPDAANLAELAQGPAGSAPSPIDPEVEIAAADHAMAAALAEQVQAELRPRLTLELGGRAPIDDVGSASFGPELDLATGFAAGLSGRERLAAARADLASAEHRIETARRAASTRRNAAARAMRAAEARHATRIDLAGSTEAVFEAHARQYADGGKSWLELMNAARELGAARAALAETDAERLAARWRVAVIGEAP